MNIKTIINKHGLISEICVIKKADGTFADYSLKAEEQAVTYINDALVNTNGVMHPPLKPKWDGTKWIDLATAEELQEAYPHSIQQPTQSERMDAQLTYTAMMTDTLLGV